MLDVEDAIVFQMRMVANAATFLAAVVVCETTSTIWKMNCVIHAIGRTFLSMRSWIISTACDASIIPPMVLI